MSVTKYAMAVTKSYTETFDISIGLNLNGGISKGIIETGLLNFTTTLFSSFINIEV